MLVKKIFLCIFISNIYSQGYDFIPLKLDAFGQFEFCLNEINPYSQSDFKIGAIKFSNLNHIPYAPRRMDFDFIGKLDTLNVTSQFNYARGDYSFRETKVLANNPISKNKNLLFKIHGRKYPGWDSSIGSGYILQNYLVDYNHIKDNHSIQITRYYHNEDISLPIYDTQSSNRLSEVSSLGMSFNLFDRTSLMGNKYNLEINYNNMFYNGQGFQDFSYPELLYLVFEQNFISSNYTVDMGEDIVSSLYLEYQRNKSLSFDSDENLIGDELLARSMGHIRWNGHYSKGFHSLDIGAYYSENESISNNYILFDYMYKFGGREGLDNYVSGPLWSLNLKRDCLINDFSGYNIWFNNSDYYLLKLSRMDLNFSIDLSLLQVELKLDDTDKIESGNLFKFEAEVGRFEEIDFDSANKGLLDMLKLRFAFYDYLDYSPINYNLSCNLKFTYSSFSNRDKYVPYVNVDFNRIALNPGFDLKLNLLNFISLGSSSEPISYNTSNIELGLIFDNFIISYNILNFGSEYYFSNISSNIDMPIYQMNYLNVKWQFQD